MEPGPLEAELAKRLKEAYARSPGLIEGKVEGRYDARGRVGVDPQQSIDAIFRMINELAYCVTRLAREIENLPGRAQT
jgi:hypothetical protein